jgi:hypothetical protein
MKLAVNAYMSFLIEGLAEALELADRLDIDQAKLAEAIKGGPLDAPIADAKLHSGTCCVVPAVAVRRCGGSRPARLQRCQACSQRRVTALSHEC